MSAGIQTVNSLGVYVLYLLILDTPRQPAEIYPTLLPVIILAAFTVPHSVTSKG